MDSLSVLIITRNASDLLEDALESIKTLSKNITLVNNGSTDNTLEIARDYGATIYSYNDPDLGKQRAFALSKIKTEWVLCLDSDERATPELCKEIFETISSRSKHNGYYIYFQTHFLGKPLYYGGENYKKLWLFKKDCVTIDPSYVHEKFILTKGKAGILKNKMLHYSYRSIFQMFIKFHNYAKREALQKYNDGEKSSLKKIFLYPPHMFWARFIKDKGYKDGLFRIPLDIGFAYMEFMTYLLLAVKYRKIDAEINLPTCRQVQHDISI
jgi:glycosyltransferase involved in cell wall biosynthesis